MFVTMVIAALIVDGLFSALDLIPTGPRPSREDIFGSVELDYKLVLNVIATVVFAALIYLTMRRGVTDPVCGMKVDRDKALLFRDGATTHFFCSDHCRDAFVAQRGGRAQSTPSPQQATSHG